MDTKDPLCLEIVNSDWHDYRGSGKDEDRLLKPGWLMQLLAQWNIGVNSPPNAETIAAFQSLRSLMQSIIQAYMQQQVPTKKDIAALNTYLDAAPLKLQLLQEGMRYQLQEVSLYNDWAWVLGEVAASFAQLLAHRDPLRLKQCENPDCRWVYYDESGNQSRRWCDDACSNLMRVRRFRARRQESHK